jgi:hypothetical protein
VSCKIDAPLTGSQPAEKEGKKLVEGAKTVALSWEYSANGEYTTKITAYERVSKW